MIDIAPFPKWREKYKVEEDTKSPFYGRVYQDSVATKRIYNYYIHPRWDFFGCETLCMKVLFADYEEEYAIVELMGEWNDALHNDIAILKRKILEPMMDKGIAKFIFICDNVLNFHGSDDCYYEELYEEVSDAEGWVLLLNIFDHINDELKANRLQYYLRFGQHFNGIVWQNLTPKMMFQVAEKLLNTEIKMLK